MSIRMTRGVVGSAVAGSVVAGTVLASVALGSGPAQAFSAPVTESEVAVHFDLKGGQSPENVVLDRNGSVDVTFAGARQVARIHESGRVSVLATLPAPKDKSAKTPLLGFPLATGLVRDGKTFYVAYATGTTAETGIWKFTEGDQPHKIADLPAASLPNGMVMDRVSGNLYVTDSALGAVYSISAKTGDVSTFSRDEALASSGFFGVNGAKIRDQHLYVSNLDKGTVLRSPLHGAKAGTWQRAAAGLEGIDDFAFTGKGNQFVATLNPTNEVVLVSGDGKKKTTVLIAEDGLSNPTAAAVRGTTVYVPSAAYSTQKDPNLLVATLGKN